MKRRHALSLGALAAIAVATANITVANANDHDKKEHGCHGCEGCHGDDEAGDEGHHE